MISQEELDQKLAEAVDTALLPLITELQALGVPGNTIHTAMRNIVQREIEGEKNESNNFNR
jgi:DNA-binding transcriptional regulator YhcF (GntR family)